MVKERDRQTDRETETDKHRQRDTDTQTERKAVRDRMRKNPIVTIIIMSTRFSIEKRKKKEKRLDVLKKKIQEKIGIVFGIFSPWIGRSNASLSLSICVYV